MLDFLHFYLDFRNVKIFGKHLQVNEMSFDDYFNKGQ